MFSHVLMAISYAKSISVTKPCDNFDGCLLAGSLSFSQPVLFPFLGPVIRIHWN